MSVVEKALSTFRQPPCMYNCAQTVCAAFNRDDLLDQMKNCGAGRAPEGTCGALYAAQTLEPRRSTEIAAAFMAANGSTKCRELKGEKRVPCTTCVATAVRLLSGEA